MPGQYILRFDDICPTMNWTVWARVEELLVKHSLQPLLAVVPDNQDQVLVAGVQDPTFWERARQWQSLGWTMGLHGYQHRYVTTNSGLMGKNAYSEFAGLSAAVQKDKLRRAVGIFEREQLRPEIFVAPAHSFDRTTIDCLLGCGIGALSDGYALSPIADRTGMTWLPQQLWEFKSRPLGLWTICLHINGWGPKELERFEKGIEAFAGRFTSVAEGLKCPPRSVNSADRIHESYLRLRLKGGKSARMALQSLRKGTNNVSMVNR